MTNDELRAILELVTGYSFEYLQSLNKEELEKLYFQRVEKRHD